MRRCLPATILLAAAVSTLPVRADDPVPLRELFNPGDRYLVSLRVELDGRMSVPVKDEKEPRLLTVVGSSILTYDERVLPADDPETAKVVRAYRTVDIRRTLNGRDQRADVRPEVRRMVVLRAGKNKVPFSPDGPLAWSEIEVVRTDVFSPVLVSGLLPARPVKTGDSWLMTASSVHDLTDMDSLDEGGFTVSFQAITPLNGKRLAKLALSGAVKGIDENGPCRHRIDGTAYFDLTANRLTYLSIRGSHELLDQNGKSAGRIDGRFTMERTDAGADALTDEQLAKVELKLTPENTLLRYDNPELGLRFDYSRRWRVGAVQGRQVTLDGPNGAGVLLTVEPPAAVPTPAAYQNEVQEFLAKQQAAVTNFAAPSAERFGLDTELGGEKLRMEYAVLAKAAGGLTLAARLPRADAGVLGKEIDRLVGSVAVTKPAK